MKLEWLEIFMNLSPNKSLNQNSADLFISQQALSSIIKKLESEFGEPLLLKSRTKGIQFTPAGLLLQESCVEFFEKINTIRRPSLQGEVKCASMINLLKGSFAQEMLLFIKRNPKLNISFDYYSDLQKAIAGLKEGKYDILFSYELYLNGQMFFYNDNLYTNDISIMYDDVNSLQHYAIECHYDFFHQKSCYLEELSDYTCYVNAPRDYSRDFLPKLFKELGCSSNIKYEDSYEIYINHLLQKNGYGIVSDANTTVVKDITLVLLKDDLVSVPVYITRTNETSNIVKEVLCQFRKTNKYGIGI